MMATRVYSDGLCRLDVNSVRHAKTKTKIQIEHQMSLSRVFQPYNEWIYAVREYIARMFPISFLLCFTRSLPHKKCHQRIKPSECTMWNTKLRWSTKKSEEVWWCTRERWKFRACGNLIVVCCSIFFLPSHVRYIHLRGTQPFDAPSPAKQWQWHTPPQPHIRKYADVVW